MKVPTADQVEFMVWACRCALVLLKGPSGVEGVDFTCEGEALTLSRADIVEMLEVAAAYGDSELTAEEVALMLTRGVAVERSE